MSETMTTVGTPNLLTRNGLSNMIASNGSLDNISVAGNLTINFSADQLEEWERFQHIIGIVVPTVFAIFLILGLIANALVVYVTVVTNRTTKHPIHSIFVLNLAAADFLFLLISPPYWITMVIVPGGWIFGDFFCPVISFTCTVTVAASIYTICALAWIRFMALVMPFRFRRSCISTRKAGYVVVVAIWIAASILAFPYLVYNRVTDEHYGMPVCKWIGPGEDQFAIAKLTANYVFPMVLVTFFYAVVGREVLCYMMHRNSAMNRGQSDERRECIKSTVVVLSLILAFLICWLPHLLETVFKLAKVFDGDDYVKERVLLAIVGKCLAYSHAFINPFIYTFASPIFRRNLRSSFREKMQNCRSGNTRCTKRGSASIVRRKPNVGGNMCLGLDISQDRTGRTSNAAGSGTNEVATPKTEQIQMLTVDYHSTSHPTEITRLASPELSNGRHWMMDALEESDGEDHGDRPMLGGEKDGKATKGHDNGLTNNGIKGCLKKNGVV